MESKKKYIEPAFVVKELEVGSILECLYDVYSGKKYDIDEPLERAFLRMLGNHLAAGMDHEELKNKLRTEFHENEPKEQYACRMKKELSVCNEAK